MSNQHAKIVCVATVVLAMVVGSVTAGDDLEFAAPQLDWSHVLQAYALIEDWVAIGSVSEAQAIRPIGVAAVGGVRVTLRWSGLTVGIGSAYPDLSAVEPYASHEAIDLVPLLADATTRALGAVDERLQDFRLPQGINHRFSDSVGANTLASVGPRLQIDLQIAHPAKRMLSSHRTSATPIGRQFIPGFHGLRMTRRVGDGLSRSAWIWPASALAANIAPHHQLVRLLADLGYGLDRLPQVGPNGEMSLERFEVIHMVRPASGLPVSRLVRGCPAVSLGDMSTGYLEAMARQLTDFLIRRQRSDGQMAGVYHPSLDRYDPLMATDRQLALAAYALGLRADALLRSGVEPERQSVVIEANQAIVDRLARQMRQAPHRPFDVAVASLLLMNLIDAPSLAPYKKDRDLLAQKLLARRGPDGRFHRSEEETSPLLGDANQALVVAALAKYYEQTRDQQLAKNLVTSQKNLWHGADVAKLNNMLPWIAMSEFQMRRWDVSQAWQSQTSDRDRLLDQLSDVLHRDHVIGSQSRDSGRLTSLAVQTDALREPSWRVADLILLATSRMTRVGDSPDRDVVQWLLACGAAAQAMAQLMFTQEACYYVRSRSDALGGVKRVVWDNRVGIEPAAMSLIALNAFQQVAVAFHPEP